MIAPPLQSLAARRPARGARDVVILGAGLAGLTAGSVLSRSGADVMIVERDPADTGHLEVLLDGPEIEDGETVRTWTLLEEGPSTTFTVSLTASDGVKQLSARVRDSAHNESETVVRSVERFSAPLTFEAHPQMEIPVVALIDVEAGLPFLLHDLDGSGSLDIVAGGVDPRVLLGHGDGTIVTGTDEI